MTVEELAKELEQINHKVLYFWKYDEHITNNATSLSVKAVRRSMQRKGNKYLKPMKF